MTTTKTKRPKLALVDFSCTAPGAKAVSVAGDFNDWDSEATPLTRADGGIWSTQIKLQPGRYEFKFVVDGQWYCKPGCVDQGDGCPDCVRNAFGTMNRVVNVGS